MCFLIFSGIVALIFGLLLLALSRKKLEGINDKANRLVSNLDNFIYRYKQGIGFCFLLSAITLLFVAYYLYKTA